MPVAFLLGPTQPYRHNPPSEKYVILDRLCWCPHLEIKIDRHVSRPSPPEGLTEFHLVRSSNVTLDESSLSGRERDGVGQLSTFALLDFLQWLWDYEQGMST